MQIAKCKLQDGKTSSFFRRSDFLFSAFRFFELILNPVKSRFRNGCIRGCGKRSLSSSNPQPSLPRFLFSFHSPALRGAAIGLVCAAVCWGLGRTPFLRTLDNWAFDACFTWRGARPSSANVIVVALDEASLQKMNKPLMFASPELAAVVEYLHAGGAAAIGIDILLPNDDATMKYLLPGGPGAAETMGQAVGRAGNVVLPVWIAKNKFPPFEWTVPSDRPWADLGFIDLAVDPDRCLRRQVLRLSDNQGKLYANMALALLMKSEKNGARTTPAVRDRREQPGAAVFQEAWFEADVLWLDGKPIPLDADDCLPINYVGPAGSIRSVPFHEVFSAASQSGEATGRASFGDWHVSFKDAVVLIGTTAGMFQDHYPTPFTTPSWVQWLRSDASNRLETMSGVEVVANVVATLADRAFITTPWWLASPPWLAVVGAAMGAILARWSLEAGALLTAAHHVAWHGLAVAAFCLGSWRVEIAPMLTLGLLLYGTVFAMRWRWIRRMMGMVKSEAVARSLESGGAKLDLRGQDREITVLFCDIRNFTTFSEKHSPHEVVQLLNAFFTAVVPAIEAEGGTINQYIGDAVMVLFGAPQFQADHARRAVRAAVEIVRRAHALQSRWKELGAEDFRVGVGVHAGRAVVGTVGSPKRLDYTAIGDTVNAASRIESANKELQSEILISEAVFAALPEDDRRCIAAAGEPVTLSVKGKQEPLRVYTIIP